MTTHNPAAQGVRRTESYVYQSLHWAFPMVPLLLLPWVFTRPSWATVGLLLVGVVASMAGLAVLHTRLRAEDALPASGWDRFRTDRLPLVEPLWAVASAITAVGVGLLPLVDTVLVVMIPAFVGACLALPLLGRVRIHPVVVGLVAVVLAEIALWSAVWLRPGPVEAVHARFSATYWVGFAAAMAVWFSVMFLNVLGTTRALERARVDGARLAVAEERLRFSRDLHDVFGRTLSAVALKAELGAAQAERGRPEAATTMREVQGIATDALAEVRTGRSAGRGDRRARVPLTRHGAQLPERRHDQARRGHPPRGGAHRACARVDLNRLALRPPQRTPLSF